MRTVSPVSLSLVLLLGALLAAADAAPAGAETVHRFPGCGVALQDCINGAAAGDVVEIATPEPVDASPLIATSITLRAAPGVAATLAAGNGIELVALGTQQPTAFTVQGLTLEEGSISLNHVSPQPSR